MATPQYFKGDPNELATDASGKPAFDMVGLQQDLFYTDAYNCFLLGAIIYDDARSPLSNAIRRDIFLQTFNDLFQSFISAGTFEAYIAVFKKIFGDEVLIEFTVPAPGKLNIDITASGVELTNMLVKQVVNDDYVYDRIITHDNYRIVFKSFKGFESQYELELMLREMVPGGPFVNINLSLD